MNQRSSNRSSNVIDWLTILACSPFAIPIVVTITSWMLEEINQLIDCLHSFLTIARISPNDTRFYKIFKQLGKGTSTFDILF